MNTLNGLFPHQAQAVESVLEKWGEFQRVLGVAPTGSGKTVIFSEVARRVAEQGGRTLIVAHREELIDQAIDKLFRATGIVAGKEKAEFRASLGAKIVVASVQTLLARGDRFPADHFTHITVDEAHHALADSYQAVISHWPNAKVLGVTATADRGDKRNLGEYFEEIAFEIRLPDLINQGYLSRIVAKTVPLKIDLAGVRKTAGDFNTGDLGTALEPMLGAAIEQIKEHAGDRKILAFLPLVQTAKTFAQLANEKGITASFVSGVCSDRREKLQSFRAGDFQLLANSMLLTEGFDEPSIDCVVILRPTQSRALFTQMVGRGTRVHPGKENLLLLDFLWACDKHSLVKAAHLVSRTAQEAELMTRIIEAERGEQALELGEVQTRAEQEREIQIAAEHAREIALRRDLEREAKKKAKTIDPIEFALSIHDQELIDYQPTMKWEAKPMTSKQIRALENLGFDKSLVTCRGHAAKLIGAYWNRQDMELATPKQVAFLRKCKHPSPGKLTKGEATKIIGDYISSSLLALTTTVTST
jgi:superfamily II DNA or RNA helicase